MKHYFHKVSITDITFIVHWIQNTTSEIKKKIVEIFGLLDLLKS